MINTRHLLLFLSLGILFLSYIYLVYTSDVSQIIIEPSTWKSASDPSTTIHGIKVTIIKK